MVSGLVGRAVGWKVGCYGSSVWSIGRPATESLVSVVWWEGRSLCWSSILWSVGRLVSQAFGGLVCQSFVHSDS